MPVTINGTSGLSGVDGSAGTPAVQGSDANTGIYFPEADTVAVSVGGTDAFRATPGGNMSITGTMAMGSSFLRNRIINGDMRIDQRNAGATITSGTVGYIVDRFNFDPSKTSGAVVSRQRSTVAPPGFTNSLGCTITTGGTPTATQSSSVYQGIEGFNISDLSLGTASAKPFTLSFWANSSVTGTHSGVIANAAFNRVYAFTYTISSGNTWTYVSVTIPGETSGTWNTDSSIGMYVAFNYGSGSSRLVSPGSWLSSPGIAYGATGSVQLINTTGATFYLTGVQLEAGNAATPFERRPYGQELALCQRYYYRTPTGAGGPVGWAGSTTTAVGVGQFPVRMRTTPTALEQSGTAADYSVAYKSSGSNCTSVPVFSTQITTDSYVVVFTTSAVLTAGEGVQCRSNTGNGYLGWSAEL